MNAQHVRAALKLIIAGADGVHDAGRIPSGMLYATLMDRMSASAFQSMIGQRTRTGLVRRESQALVWVAGGRLPRDPC
jgi:hypothetical protein